jgi:hypothetical protein
MDQQKIREYIELRQLMHYIDDPAVPQYKALVIVLRTLTDSMTVTDVHCALFQYHQWFAAHVQVEPTVSDMSLVDQWLHARHELSVLMSVTEDTVAIEAARAKLDAITAEMDLADLTTANDTYVEDYA